MDKTSFGEKLEEARLQYKANRERLEKSKSALDAVAGFPNARHHIVNGIQRLKSKSRHQFRVQLVEPLFQQATTFIDRVLAEDSSYKSLAVDRLNLRLDLDELGRLQSINDDEVAAGLFQVPFWEAGASLESDKALQQSQNGLVAFIDSHSERQANLAAWTAENGQQPLATGWEGKLSEHKVRLYNGYTPPASEVPSGAKASDGNIIGGILAHEISSYGFTYLREQLSAQQAPVNARLDPLQKRVSYLQADAGFRERRKISAHQKLTDKLSAVQAPNGPLNYDARMTAIEDRAAIDLAEAYERLKSVAVGMELIYGIEMPKLPAWPSAPPQDDDYQFLNKLVAWARRAALLLQKVYDNDQEFVMSFSVAGLAKPHHFSAGKQTGEWHFDIPSNRFAGLRLIRLRGVSASVNICPLHLKKQVFSFILVRPKQSSGDGLSVDPCWLGRVRGDHCNIRPDVVGTPVLWNASPIGGWSIKLAPGVEPDGLEDIEINFHVVANAVR